MAWKSISFDEIQQELKDAILEKISEGFEISNIIESNDEYGKWLYAYMVSDKVDWYWHLCNKKDSNSVYKSRYTKDIFFNCYGIKK